MADNNEIDVDIGLGGNPLEASFKNTLDYMQRMLVVARETERLVANTAARHSEYQKNAKQLRDERGATLPGEAGADDRKRLDDRMAALTANYKTYNDEIAREITLQRGLSLARGAGERRADSRVSPDGRTGYQARQAENALKAAILNIDTTTEQLTARLGLAVTKAAERLVTSTATALESSLRAKTAAVESRNAQMALPGIVDARIINATVAGQKEIRTASKGSTLEERDANAAAEANARYLSGIRRRSLDRIEADRARADKEAQDKEIANATYLAGVRRRSLTLVERDRVKDEQEAAAVAAANATYLAGLRRRSLAIIETQRVKEDKEAQDKELANAVYLAGLRRRSLEKIEADRVKAEKEAQDKITAEATYLTGLRRRSLTMAENDRVKDEQEVANKAAANARYLGGIRRRSLDRIEADRVKSDKEAQDKEIANVNYLAGLRRRSLTMVENDRVKSEKEATDLAAAQAAYLAGVRRRSLANIERDRVADERRTQAASPEARQGRIQNQIDNRNALMDSNGGADMFTFQAKLAANYAIFGAITGAITGSIRAIIQFDDALKQFQAITATSNSEMGSFRANLLGVAADSKFSILELTQVAVALGQTGLAADGVIKALRPVMNLAAASGATLQQSVEAITAVLGAYNMEASRAGDIADVFVAALNRTKLTMDQLQLGIQYAANIARESGVSFSELTASIGGMAQAGIKSGSTIGTGLRQLITELTAPNDKLRAVYKELGINLADVDVRTQGFIPVLEKLRSSGFTAADALRGLDLRAANAFSALGGQAGKIKLLEQEFLLTSAAAEGAAKANESFTASSQRLTNVIFSLVDKAFAPLVTILASAAGGTANLLAKIGDLGPTLPLLATGVGSIATAFAAIKITNLVAGLAGFGTLLSTGLLATGGLAAGIAAGGGLIYYLSTLQSEADKAREKIDQLKGIENGLTARQSALQTGTQDLNLRIETLIARRDKLNEDPILTQNAIIDAQKSFAEFGLVIEGGQNNVDGLITALKNLRGEMAQQLPVILTQQLQNLGKQLDELRKLEALREKENRPSLQTVGLGRQVPMQVDYKPNQDIRALGPQGNAVADYLAGYTKLNPENPAGGQAAILNAQLRSERVSLGEQERALQMDTGNPQQDETLKMIRERIITLDKATALFSDKIANLANQQANIVATRRTQASLDADALRVQTEMATGTNTFADRANALKGQQDANEMAAMRGSAPGIGQIRAMQEALRLTDTQVQAQIDAIKEASAKAEKEGVSKEVIKEAFSGTIDSLTVLLRSTTKQVRERFDMAAPAARAQLTREQRAAEAQLALTQRQAQTSNDPARVQELSGLAEHYQDIINKTRIELFKLAQGVNADQVIAGNEDLKLAMEQIKTQGNADVTRLGITYAEIHRKVMQAQLSYQGDRLGERKDLLDTQIKGLEKIRDDARSTPEQAANAVKEINRLLEQVATILQGINKINVDKGDLKFPDKVPSTYMPGVGGRDALLEMAKANGASEDRIRYLLNTAQMESGYDPRVISGEKKSSAGATGIFQFMPKTWENMYGTKNVNVDLAAQYKAMQDFTNRNAGTFQSNMGRQATDEELYLMHQQGAGGALALLRGGSGMTAIDALTPAYAGRGGAATAEKAVRGNMGNDAFRADITAEEFMNLILRKYRAAEAKVGDPFGSTGEKAQARSRTLTADKTTEEIENKKAANLRAGEAADRASRLADIKKQDSALGDVYDNQLLSIKKLQNPAAAASANADALKTLGELYGNAQKRDTIRLDREGPDERDREVAATKDKFAAQFADQGLTTADTIGKAYSKQFTDELANLQAQRKELERPENEGKEGNTAQINALNDQINLLQKRNELQGPYEQNQAKIAALEQTLAEMKRLGLDTDKQTFTVREKLRDLYGQNKILEPARNLQAKQEKTERTLGSAATAATDSYLKSRGVLDIKGQVADPLIEAQKRIEESLNVIGGAFDNLWVNLTNGSMTAGQALKKFATDVLGGLMTSLSKSITNDIFRSIFTSGATGSASGGGILDSIMSLFGGGKYLGGPIRKAGGGSIPQGDAAEAGRDSVLIHAQPGEFMLRKSAVDAIGVDKLEQVNALGSTMVQRQPQIDTGKMRSVSQANANVYVVDRDQVPVPGSDDFVYAIGQDIMRGGTTKQLIKRVAAGG